MNDPQSTPDVLEQNVSTLLESGGEAPRISDAARARIRTDLVATHGKPEVRRRSWRLPAIALGAGLAVAAATALVVTRVAGDADSTTTSLADGSTFVTAPGGKVTVLGARRVRVEGAALLDVAPGKGTFVVETAGGTIEVLGTRFLVDAQAAKTTTAVVRGEVKLASALGSVLVHAGEQAVAEPGRAPVRGPAPRLSHLVSWAQHARRREENGVTPLRHGSLFARSPGLRPDGTFGTEFPLPIKQLTLDVVVENRVARVALDQTFHNPVGSIVEGVYKFAIPPDAALQRLAMYVDGTLTESAVVERMQARRIYEELVYRRIDPALLEYAGTGRLNLRIYPIPAHSDKRVLLAYTQSIPKLYTDWSIVVPLPEVDQPVGELAVRTVIKGCANCELSAPGHDIVVERAGNDATVKLKSTGTKLGDSFVVHVREGKSVTTVATAVEGASRFMMVRAPAELAAAAREHRRRTWVLLDDVSASRSAPELAAQSDLVDALLREIDEDDRVALVAFDVEARTLLAPTRVDDVDRRAIRKALKDEGGVGATDIDKALDAAIATLSGVAPEDAMIVYLGDGVITNGPRNLELLRKKVAGKARFVGVGVGDGPDTQTLGALAAASGGYATTFDLGDDLRWRAFDLVAALHTSRVTGVDARLVDASGALVPSTSYLRSPQLSDGEEIELVAKLANDAQPVALELTGSRDGARWTQHIALSQPASVDAGYLPRLWAGHHVASRLLAKHELVVVPPCTQIVTRTDPGAVCPTEAQLRQTRDEEIRKEVVTLGKQYFLLSRHTSLLVLENDAMYAQYGVRKGAGDTWAPYALPAKIPVVAMSPSTSMPMDVADDAELVRTPLQIFYDNHALPLADRPSLGVGHGRGKGGSRVFVVGAVTEGDDWDEQIGGAQTRGELGLSQRAAFDEVATGEVFKTDESEQSRVHGETAKAAKPTMILGKRSRVMAGEFAGVGGGGGFLRRQSVTRGPARRERSYGYDGTSALTPMRFTYAADSAFDDLTALVPALGSDAADAWRAELLAAGGTKGASYPIDAGSKVLLASARANLPSGIYRWGDLEVAVDTARRIGWRMTTDADLAETASFDGSTWTRRYAELGITTQRTQKEDDVPLSLAYLPIWIAEPEHYARWFSVASRGPREIALSNVRNGKTELAFVLQFDDKARLVAITDARGEKLLTVTWSAAGPTGARSGGEDIAVTYTASAIADAAQWAHGSAPAGVVVELPLRVPAYWQSKRSAESAGSPAWRHASRQLLASTAAIHDARVLAATFDEMRKSSTVERGDLVLASAGLATTAPQQLADALAPLANDPVARYLIAGRVFARATSKAALREPETRDGMLGALWTLRSAVARLRAQDLKAATTELTSLGTRAYTLRLVGVSILSQSWTGEAAELVKLWDSVATGPYANIARAEAAQRLYGLGRYDAAADQIVRVVDNLDLAALPPQMPSGVVAFQYSNRGIVGSHLVLAKWRDRVLAGSSVDHVLSVLALRASNQGDVSRLFTHAAALAANDADDSLAIARVALDYGHPTIAWDIVEPMLKRSPTRELYALAASLARSRSDLPGALRYLEQAQGVGADEAVDINTVRYELHEIIALAQQVALTSSGVGRADAVARALDWARKWRTIDPGNTQIDRIVGELLLATGDTAGAWRQLSSIIERDPWSGASYATIADLLEREGRATEALDVWQQAIVIDQTNPTHRLRKAQALFALGRKADGDEVLRQVTTQKWHAMWSGTVWQAKSLLERSAKAP